VYIAFRMVSVLPVNMSCSQTAAVLPYSVKWITEWTIKKGVHSLRQHWNIAKVFMLDTFSQKPSYNDMLETQTVSCSLYHYCTWRNDKLSFAFRLKNYLRTDSYFKMFYAGFNSVSSEKYTYETWGITKKN
jgi:hypothetical protein